MNTECISDIATINARCDAFLNQAQDVKRADIGFDCEWCVTILVGKDQLPLFKSLTKRKYLSYRQKNFEVESTSNLKI